ncbi:MAG: glycosyl hydrolase family 65 protein, partial [Verrucomicrobiota bacterium]
ILLYLEGLAGLKLSIPDRRLIVSPALPATWAWMEVRLPIEGAWTRIRYTQEEVQVSGCPLNVELERRLTRDGR